ncbi:MAG: hypothetical protein WCP69_06525 [Bacteroidota bacterium]
MENEIFDLLLSKGNFKQDIYDQTCKGFESMRNIALDFEKEYNLKYKNANPRINVEVTNISDFEFSLKFATDMLVFMMHTNVFEFPRAHDVFKLPYVKEDVSRSYCGIINIYNFLADSFKYNRINDSGYLIGRIFINKDNHYYIEGKHEMGLQFNNFSQNVFEDKFRAEVLAASVKYAINFDLLTPPYDNLKEITVLDVKQLEMQNMTLKTAKRMGFKFQSDKEDTKS